jgi:MerR family transcriptional regulator, light-induced transcriptional regulator
VREDGVAVSLVSSLLNSGVAPDVIIMDVLAPTAETLAEVWYRDACDFVEVTVAVGRLQRTLRELGQRQTLIPTKAISPGQVLLSSLSG